MPRKSACLISVFFLSKLSSIQGKRIYLHVNKRQGISGFCSNLIIIFFLWQMSAVGITENAKGDNKKFEIWCNSREEVYIVQVNLNISYI